MRKKNYVIPRHENGELVRETFKVAPMKRDYLSFLGTLSPRKRELVREVQTIIDKDAPNVTLHGLKAPAEVSRRIRKCHSSTLEIIISHFGGGRHDGAIQIIDSWLTGLSVSERSFRERVRFHDVLAPVTGVASMNIPDAVRTCHEMFMVEDLSELPEDKAVLAAAVMTVVRDAFYAGDDVSPAVAMEIRMSRSLARFIIAHHDRAHDISDYMVTRKLGVFDVDTDALADYLGNSTRSLSTGVL